MAIRREDGDEQPAMTQLSLFPPDPADATERGSDGAPDLEPAPEIGDALAGAPVGSAEDRAAPEEAPRPRRRPASLEAAIVEYKQFLVAQNRAKHTQMSFGLDLKLLLECLGDLGLGQIGEPELRRFISWVRIERKNSAVSVRRKIASLKNFFAYLYREQLIPHDPALGLIYPETYPALPEFLEDQKVAALLEAAAEHPFWYALLALMLDTGLKRDEMVALGWGDVSLGESVEHESYLVVRDTEQAKRLRSRRLEISTEVADRLRAYRAEQAIRERFFDISARGINFIVEVCGARAHTVTRGKKLTPQILRETYAVRRMRIMVREEDTLREAGVREETVAS